jgi:hypothetical protein
MSFKNPSVNQIRFITVKDSSAMDTALAPKLRVRNYNTDWIFILLCLCFALFAFINTVYKKRVLQLMKAFWVSNYSNQLVKAENVLIKQASLLLSVLFLFSFSLFSYQLVHHYYRNFLIYSGLELYFLIMLCLIAFYAVKLLCFTLVAVIFKADDETKEYTFNVFLINQTIGLLLFPLVALINYLPANNRAVLLFVGLLLIVSFFLFRIIKGLVSLWFSGVFSKSYLFLYLCALEILPLIVIGKFIFDKYQL